MNEKIDLKHLLEEIINREELLSITLSSPLHNKTTSKATVRPLLIKDQLHYQLTEQKEKQTFHRNLDKTECLEWLKKHVPAYKQSFMQTAEANFQILAGKKGNIKILKKTATKKNISFEHNREKQYILSEGKAIPFLVQLGVMNASGKVYPGKMDKFRQINRFLEMINDVLPHFDITHPLRIVDFGCGKAYLTFALYHFFKIIKGFKVKLIGLDLKKEVILFCQKLALELGYEKDLQFFCEDIENFHLEKNPFENRDRELKNKQEPVDLVVSLHACDIATDAALEKAIRWNSRVILSAPCCQHELLNQIQQEALQPILKHGILKERFSALATDAARV